MKKRVVFVLAIMACFFIGGCGKEKVGNNSLKEVEKISMQNGEIDLSNVKEVTQSYNTYLSIAEDASNDNNTAFSPTSLNYAIGMAFLGANNATNDAIGNYFGGNVKNVSTRHLELSKTWEKNSDVEIAVSNMVACDKSIPLLDTYIRDLADKYNANIVNKYDFIEDATIVANELNQFCDESTKGMIPQVVNEDAVRDGKLMIVNALYFNGKWKEPFLENDTNIEDFSNGDGTKSDVTMMSSSGSCYFENENAVGFSKEYVGGNFEFIGILPNKKVCDKNSNFKINDIDLDGLLNSRTYEYDVEYKFPKFKLESDLDLNNALCKTSLAEIYSNAADFSNMSTKPLFVNSTIQKVVIDVNEEGTKAAAVTVVTMKTNACIDMPKETKYVYLDRPFMFLIYDKENDEVMFIGKVSNL